MKLFSIPLFGRSVALATALALAVVLVPAFDAAAGEIVDHPDKLKYKDLNYKPPKPNDSRHELDCGATVYVAENAEVPTLQVTVLVRTGSMYEPLEK
ncbi:MAG: hypothetical protein KAJ37_05330, partial [Candidatus Krumholzibacteria bacterium]|nr:hypothetical protein [Candidatus Krumholzibacteria bacterium]